MLFQELRKSKKFYPNFS